MTTGQSHDPDEELIDDIIEFYNVYSRDDISTLAQEYPNDSTSLTVEWMDIYKYDAGLADDVRNNPDQMQEYFEESLSLYDLPVDIDLSGAHVRFTGLNEPMTYEVDELRANQRKDLVSVRGHVTKRTEIKPRITMAAFECQRCGTLNRIEQVANYDMQEPHECQGCERQGPFRINYNQSQFVDHQLMRVQKPPEKTKGAEGDTMDIVLEGDIVDAADAGDRITASGVMNLTKDDPDALVYNTFLDGHHVDINQTDYEDIDVDKHEADILELANSDNPIETLAQSVAPKIYGHDEIKEAVTLQLFGGTSINYPSGSRDRGDFHVLLIGDPGCGKSTILDAAKEISPRSTKASGKGASKSGLTAAAVRDDFGDSEWTLDAGAMVMADKGIACVDEIDKIDEETTSALHEALESQEIPVNKAGINTTLPARTSLLAAGNPEFGRFDTYEPIGEQIDIGPTLLSRFDLIFTVIDNPDRERDETVARHNVEFRRAGNEYTYGHGDEDAINTVEPEVGEELFRAYIAYAKQNYNPQITKEAAEDLINRYVAFRSLAEDDDAPIPITPRWIEALQRLAEASARARLSDTVEIEDMERAADLVQRSMRDVGMDPESGEFDADVVETGMSKSQRDRVKTIKTLIQEIEQEYNNGSPHEILVDRATDSGFDRADVQKSIKKLKDKGEIYEPKSEHYRTT